ncbi:hypothetical protein KC343_g4081 [Hortaea werneckii]|uniref:Uncharacterized protein n=1 Tax=Hortaea werneckii TaxID=91943 RepID=A0A3M7G4I8_HORWE|nr:hypothetical protein KC323_g7487 [Hortaea werneckii]KAI7124594.1 hypothetical protein KC352_g32321 [Hortaea werneckii]KAI7569473.1 hypothetical protein KC317_g3300 [Hortaea werneckii]KAI7622379.1 hypothetical protein KC346_g3242 [Hortaea werneckii]KAI7631349.1 hypothetical protein KC343_g4081 [Hortaea werneckii]
MQLSEYLSQEEVTQLNQAFNIALQHDLALVFWTGISPELARDWARRNGLKTLTMAMGDLYTDNVRKPVRSVNPGKSKKSWSRYLKGASWIFAQHACQGRCAIVLTNAPPHVYSQRKHSNYREIEEPILKGFEADRRTIQIDYVHPRVPGAEDFRYQVWPEDWSSKWLGFFECIVIKDIVKRFVQGTFVRRLKKVKETESVSTTSYERSASLATIDEKSKTEIMQKKDLMKQKNAEVHQLAAQQAAQDKKAAKRLKLEREQQAAQDKKAAKRLKLEREQQAARDKKAAKRLKLEREQQAAQEKKAAKRLKLEREQQAAQDKKAAKRLKLDKEQQAAQHKKAAKRLKLEREQQAAQDKKAAKRLKLEREQQAAQDKKAGKRLKLEREQQAAQDKKAAKRLKLEKVQYCFSGAVVAVATKTSFSASSAIPREQCHMGRKT